MPGLVVAYENLIWPLPHNLRGKPSLVSAIITVYTTDVLTMY